LLQRRTLQTLKEIMNTSLGKRKGRWPYRFSLEVVPVAIELKSHGLGDRDQARNI
jgi:hypothetical protein